MNFSSFRVGFFRAYNFLGYNLVFLGGVLRVWCCQLVGFGVWGLVFFGLKIFRV